MLGADSKTIRKLVKSTSRKDGFKAIAIIDLKALSAAQAAQAKGDVRYYLNGIHLDPCGTLVGCTGHYMAAVGPDAWMPLLPPAEMKDMGHIIIKAVKPPTKAMLNAADGIAVLWEGARREFQLRAGKETVEVPGIDGHYPDWRRIVDIDALSEDRPAGPVAAQGSAYMAIVAEVAKRMAPYRKDNDYYGLAVRPLFSKEGGNTTCLIQPHDRNSENGMAIHALVTIMSVRDESDAAIERAKAILG